MNRIEKDEDYYIEWTRNSDLKSIFLESKEKVIIEGDLDKDYVILSQDDTEKYWYLSIVKPNIKEVKEKLESYQDQYKAKARH